MGRRCGDAPHLAPYGNQRYGSPCFAILAQPTTVVTRLNNLAEDLIRCVRLAGKRTPSVWLGLRWCARVLAGYHFLLNISLSVGREIFDRQWDTTTGTALCSWRKREQDCDTRKLHQFRLRRCWNCNNLWRQVSANLDCSAWRLPETYSSRLMASTMAAVEAPFTSHVPGFLNHAVSCLNRGATQSNYGPLDNNANQGPPSTYLRTRNLF
jgi:hypothetical protein